MNVRLGIGGKRYEFECQMLTGEIGERQKVEGSKARVENGERRRFYG